MFTVDDSRIALVICEDMWLDDGPVSRVAAQGADLLLVINASPFERDKDEVRIPLATRRAREQGVPVAYVNLVGGQDDLVFDGDSFVVAPDGELLARAPQFTPHVLQADLPALSARGLPRVGSAPVSPRERPLAGSGVVALEGLAEVWGALVLGLRDYVEKNRFPSVVLGLSGGIDSAVCAAIAADARTACTG